MTREPKKPRAVPFERSLAALAASAVPLLDAKRNDLSVSEIGAKSNVVMWWTCPVADDHRYQKRVFEVTAACTEGYEPCVFCNGAQILYRDSLAGRHPELGAEWDVEHNKREASNVRFDFARVVRWVCPRCSRRWYSYIKERLEGRNCPKCEPKKRVTLEDRIESGTAEVRTVSLATEYPAVAAEWHPEKNGDAEPGFYAPSSGRSAWWRCSTDQRHEWRASIGNRTTLNSGCPYCSGALASPGNNLAELYPDLMAEWDYERNTADPHQIRPGSNTKYCWKCSKGPDHLWLASPATRTLQGSGCLSCANLQLSVTNSLATSPNAVELWCKAMNGAVRPSMVLRGSRQRFWFKCNKGPDHVWMAPAHSVGRDGKGCPFCAGARPSVTNNLQGKYPHIAAELDDPRFDAEMLLAHTHKRLQWRCAVDATHTWKMVVKDRTLDGIGCPWCHVPNTSRREVDLAAELEAVIGGSWNVKVVGLSGKTWACDWADQDRKLIVEYDGNRWHDDRLERDQRKTSDLIAAGWNVLRVREKDLPLVGPLDFEMRSQWSVRHMVREITGRFITAGLVDPQALDGYRKRGPNLSTDVAEQRWTDLRKAQNDRDKRLGRPARKRRQRSNAS